MPVPVWLRKLNHRFGHILEGSGSWSVTELERSLIDQVEAKLEPSTRTLLHRQLAEEYLVDRTNDRISSIYFYRLPEALLIPDPDFQDLLFKVRMKVDGRTQTNRVTFYRGRIFGVELRKPRKDYADAEIEVLDVTRGEPKNTLTSVIDRAAHGKS